MTDAPLVIRGAREHNLQDVSLTLPRNQLIVMTGVSGSGKSSLAFDTLYAEGQRRYVESLSSYARQFLGQMPKPDVDAITGLAPSISIQQKTAGKNPRSTVGTITEIYDYLRVLFARIGRPTCYQCGRPISAQTREQILDQILLLAEGTRFSILAPLVQRQKGEFKDLFEDLLKQGFLRARVDGKTVQLDADLKLDKQMKHTIDVVVDRLIIGKTPRPRIAEAVEQALNLAKGKLIVSREDGRGTTSAVADLPPPDMDDEDDDDSPSLNSPLSTLNPSDQLFSSDYACTHCGISYEPPSPQLFSFNSPLGMCPDCNGLGMRHDFVMSQLIPDGSLSIAKGAIALLGKLTSVGRWRRHIIDGVARVIEKEAGLPEKAFLKTPWDDLPDAARQLFLRGLGTRNIAFAFKHKGGVWKHGGTYSGFVPELLEEYRKTKNPMRRKQLEKYMEFVACATCHGSRLSPQAGSYRITSRSETRIERSPGKAFPGLPENARSLPEVCSLSIAEAVQFFGDLELNETEQFIAEEVLKEIRGRLGFLLRCGLDYLTLDRTAPTLSGGESQRIRLAGQIGCGLVGVVYILDEPSIGLHPRDNVMLLGSLQDLRDQGNTVIVVEHDEDTIRAADHVVDFGPGPGVRGGRIVAEGSVDDVKQAKESVTGAFLSGRRTIEIPKRRDLSHLSGGSHPPVPASDSAPEVPAAPRKTKNASKKAVKEQAEQLVLPATNQGGDTPRSPGKKITIAGATHHNLKNVSVDIPLGAFVVITGVSGSGKSSLINDILWEVLNRDINGGDGQPGAHQEILGLDQIDKAIDIDQSPIGRTPRSNPATYVKLFDLIRDLYTKLPDSKLRGFEAGRFSFNVEGGRCEACEGNGATKLEMDFLADIWVTCPVCQGKRFNKETLEIRFKGKSIADVLDMDVQQALEHFEAIPKIKQLLQTLHDVGLDYIKLGQPSPTLSGGEAQRVKLAKELGKRSTGKTIYILDEPTTGLHFVDIEHLLRVLHGFVDSGNTVIVVEHNLDVIKTADWIIDLGPEGGSGGGTIVATGTPEQIAACERSYTGQALRATLSGNHALIAEPRSPGIAIPGLPKGARWQSAGSLKHQRGANENIVVRGAAQHNLQKVDLEIPREKMSVFCGPSGSGKSSLAMDTLYAEGQRRYVESLSSYARQFLGQMPKPRVEHIHGLQPAIAIEQKTVGHTPRSTVGTVTEIYDYLRILYARLGTLHCPDCQIPVETQTTDDVIDKLQAFPEKTRLLILAPQEVTVGQQYPKLWERLREQGFRRVRVDGETYTLDDVPEIDRRRKHTVEIVVDRVSIAAGGRSRLAESVEAAFDLGQGLIRVAHVDDTRPEPKWTVEPYSLFRACTKCGRSFEELTPQNFSFNSPLGWCPSCEGLGTQQGTNLAALIGDPSRTLLQGAVTAWPDPATRPLFRQMLDAVSHEFRLPLDVPFSQLEAAQQRIVLYGTGDRWISSSPSGGCQPPGSTPEVTMAARKTKKATKKAVKEQTSSNADTTSNQGVDTPRSVKPFSFQYKGLYPAIEEASRVSYAYRQSLHELIGEVPCSTCDGSRLRDDAANVRLNGKTLRQLTSMPLSEALAFLNALKLTAPQRKIAGDLLAEATGRLTFLVDVGLHYLTLNRPLPTLSGGETQRIRLAGQIGRALTGVLYVLDEPTIGLHPSDNGRLLVALKKLRDLGNTIVMVEHDREVLDAADRLYDFGPGAGRFGGTVTAQGTPKEICRNTNSLTGKYLADREEIVIPKERRMCPASGGSHPPDSTPEVPATPRKTKKASKKAVKEQAEQLVLITSNQGVDTPGSVGTMPPGGGWLELLGARLNNLRNVDLRIPLGTLTAITGVSGSGKSSLIEDTLAKAIAKILNRSNQRPGPYDELKGLQLLNKLIVVDQQPLGSTPASNPATYTGVFDEIRELFARLPDAKVRGYRPARFSFNRPGGRCEACEGNGQKCIEMHFLPDVWVECEECRGRRYNPETLAVKYRGKSIADVLEMSIGEARELFENIPKIRGPLAVLCEIGLDYLTLGQSAPTLSGGEAQRVKLAAELAKPQSGRTLYLLDEPTTGLHFDDIRKLLKILNSLVDAGNTVVVVEHNLDVIKTVDWIVDMGPHAGSEGGWIVAEGTPEEIVQHRSPGKAFPRLPALRSLTAESLAPVLNTGSRGDRDSFDVTSVTRKRKTDVDLKKIGESAKMPWEVDGRKWHTQDRISHGGKPCRWDGQILARLVDTLEEHPGFAAANWNERGVVEVAGKKAAQVGWFLHALTGDEWLLYLHFRVPRKTFVEESLRSSFALTEIDAMDDVPLNNRQARVRVRDAKPPWQEVIISVLKPEDVDTPAFAEFLETAMAAYLSALSPEKLDIDELTPWKKLGRKWHLMRKGFLQGRIEWDAEVLEQLFQLLDDIWSDAKVDWTGKVVVNYKRGAERLASVTTKRPAHVELNLFAPRGTVPLGLVSPLATDTEVTRHDDDTDVIRLRFTTAAEVTAPALRRLLADWPPKGR